MKVFTLELCTIWRAVYKQWPHRRKMNANINIPQTASLHFNYSLNFSVRHKMSNIQQWSDVLSQKMMYYKDGNIAVFVDLTCLGGDFLVGRVFWMSRNRPECKVYLSLTSRPAVRSWRATTKRQHCLWRPAHADHTSWDSRPQVARLESLWDRLLEHPVPVDGGHPVRVGGRVVVAPEDNVQDICNICNICKIQNMQNIKF